MTLTILMTSILFVILPLTIILSPLCFPLVVSEKSREKKVKWRRGREITFLYVMALEKMSFGRRIAAEKKEQKDVGQMNGNLEVIVGCSSWQEALHGIIHDQQ